MACVGNRTTARKACGEAHWKSPRERAARGFQTLRLRVSQISSTESSPRGASCSGAARFAAAVQIENLDPEREPKCFGDHGQSSELPSQESALQFPSSLADQSIPSPNPQELGQ